MEEQLIIDVWDTFKDYVPEKLRDTAASQYVDFLIGQDVDTETLEGLKGYDSHLDQAIELVIEDNDEENFEDDEGYAEDDEDY